MPDGQFIQILDSLKRIENRLFSISLVISLIVILTNVVLLTILVTD